MEEMMDLSKRCVHAVLSSFSLNSTEFLAAVFTVVVRTVGNLEPNLRERPGVPNS